MRQRTLTLIATPAVLGAMTIAVPALAGISIPIGHTATSHTHCFTAHVGKRNVRECLIPGPRGLKGPRGLRGLPGPAGPRGFTGPRGPRGYTGKTGKTGATGAPGTPGAPGAPGATGAPGTARAFAVVEPTSATAATLIPGHTSNITGVTEPTPGVYCLVPATGIDPAADTAAVSPEVSYDVGEAGPGLIAVNAQRKGGCAAGDFEVDTYAPGGVTRATGYAFTIVVP